MDGSKMPVVVEVTCQIEGNKREKELPRHPSLPVCLIVRALRSLCLRKELLRLPRKSLGPGLQTPSLAHSIPTNEEVLCPTIPHTVVTRPGAGNHRATSQTGAVMDTCGAQPYEISLGAREGEWGQRAGWAIAAEGLAGSVRWIP